MHACVQKFDATDTAQIFLELNADFVLVYSVSNVRLSKKKEKEFLLYGLAFSLSSPERCVPCDITARRSPDGAQ